MFITNGVNARIGRRDGALLRVGAGGIQEFVVNGDGDDATGWVSARGNSTIASVSGRIRATMTTAATGGFEQEITGLTQDATYNLEIQVFNGSASKTAFLRFQNASGLSQGTNVATSTSGGNITYSGTVIAISTTMYLGAILGSAAIGEYIECDNVSLTPA